MTEPTFKPKKSVALSGVPAGNTALCTVGRNGNDLHYRGYDIARPRRSTASSKRSPTSCSTASSQTRNRTRPHTNSEAHAASAASPPSSPQSSLEQLPAATHPMDVLRTGVSALG